jgi:hypothetical protein
MFPGSRTLTVQDMLTLQVLVQKVNEAAQSVEYETLSVALLRERDVTVESRLSDARIKLLDSANALVMFSPKGDANDQNQSQNQRD